MNKAAIERAVQEAKRFLERAKDYKKATSEPDGSYEYMGQIHKTYPSAPKESGALRRASLDLTRALAEMRKP